MALSRRLVSIDRRLCDLCGKCHGKCPTGAIEYGDLDEISKKVKSRSVKFLKDKKLLLKKTGGG